MIRTFISLPAGVVRMTFWRFTVYTVLGLPPWVLALTWIGALLGERWDRAEAVIRPFAWVIAIALVLGSRGSSGIGSVRSDARRRPGSRARRRSPGVSLAGFVGPSLVGARRLDAAGIDELRFGVPSAELGAHHPVLALGLLADRSNPARSYIIRDRLCTATESESAW